MACTEPGAPNSHLLAEAPAIPVPDLPAAPQALPAASQALPAGATTA